MKLMEQSVDEAIQVQPIYFSARNKVTSDILEREGLKNGNFHSPIPYVIDKLDCPEDLSAVIEAFSDDNRINKLGSYSVRVINNPEFDIDEPHFKNGIGLKDHFEPVAHNVIREFLRISSEDFRLFMGEEIDKVKYQKILLTMIWNGPKADHREFGHTDDIPCKGKKPLAHIMTFGETTLNAVGLGRQSNNGTNVRFFDLEKFKSFCQVESGEIVRHTNTTIHKTPHKITKPRLTLRAEHILV
jgi:hypothetical protein